MEITNEAYEDKAVKLFRNAGSDQFCDRSTHAKKKLWMAAPKAETWKEIIPEIIDRTMDLGQPWDSMSVEYVGQHTLPSTDCCSVTKKVATVPPFKTIAFVT